MNSDQAMPYKTTSQLQLSKIAFESMINNLGNRIRKMNLTIHFKSQSQKQKFLLIMQKYKQRDLNTIELQASDNQHEIISHKNISIQQQQKLDYIQIQQTFQKSILLRKHFIHKFQQIQSRLGVKFMIVPNKVKIRGIIKDRVDQAQDQYRLIQQDICMESIDDYGKEIYYSKYFKKYLEIHHIYVIKILKRYYYWFLKSKVQNPIDVIRQVFRQTKHYYYPLRTLKKYEKQVLASGKVVPHLGQIQLKIHQRITQRLLVRIKSRLFQQIGIKKLNHLEDKQSRHIELSQQRLGLILHVDAEQQLSIQMQSIEQQYNNYQHFYIIFDEGVNMSDFKQQMKYFSTNNLLLQLQNNYLCICIQKINIIKQQQIQQHCLIKLIKQLPQQYLNFKLGLLGLFTLPQNQQLIFLSSNKNIIQKITQIGVKMKTKQKIYKMIKLYLYKKLNQENHYKQDKSQSNAIINQTQNINPNITIDFTKINQSTQFLFNQIDKTKIISQSISNKIQQKQQQNVLNKSLLQNHFHYQNYITYLIQKQQDKNKKYNTQINNLIEKSKIPSKNQQGQKFMINYTTYKFKFYKIKILQEHKYINMQDKVNQILSAKPELTNINRWVTVFTTSEDSKLIYTKQNKIKIMKIQKNSKIKDGYLLTTNLLFIHEEETQLSYGSYEAIYWIKKIE